ncbi:MAG: hypothetical protein RI995_1498 [Bacteroidota bacterium]
MPKLLQLFICIIFFISVTNGSALLAADSTAVERHVSGNITVTQNGISLLPNMSLGKPALIMEYSLGSKKYAFEPQLRFSLDGKPWSFIFWFRKRLQYKKFGLTLGTHPSIVFKRKNVMDANGETIESLDVQQYAVGEISPNYRISPNTTIGMYYLTSFAWINAPVHQTQFVTLNAVMNNIKLGGNFRLRVFPQVYFLKMDDIQGTYATATLTLSHKKSPIFISTILNQKFNSTIPGKDFVWNVSLGYSFNTEWSKK